MPAISSISRLSPLVARNATAAATNATGDALQVVCAWPLSGQYGPGSRVFYYVLIAVCIYARKAEWLKNALLIPAIAALHGIVLMAVHVDGAVDMDVYGAFQLCSIGILTVPITLKLSRMVYDRSGSIILLWFIFILAGMLSLTAEFFRLRTFDCTRDNFGNPISPNAGEFPYGTMCGLKCSIDQGPFSPMRSGSVNNIYVIPAPDKITFPTATLLTAVCCIPVTLLLMNMWCEIPTVNWQKHFSVRDNNGPIEGTNSATTKKINNVNALIMMYKSLVEIAVFGGAALATTIIGEWNFFSSQVYYQNEPMAAIGQWAPVSGATLAVLGVLYARLSVDPEDVTAEAVNLPDIPGEEHRNQRPSQIGEKYNQSRDANGNVVPTLRGSASRAGSFTGITASRFGVEDSSTRPRAASLPTAFAPPLTPRGPHDSTLLADRL